MPRLAHIAGSATMASVAGQRQCRSVYRPMMSSPTSHSNEDPGEASSSSGTVEAVNIIQAEDGCDGKDDEKKAKKNVNRCAVCNKKVGLTGFMCRCGGLFCAVHRYSDKHQCTFDYREMGAEEIRRNNPVVVGEKVKKI